MFKNVVRSIDPSRGLKGAAKVVLCLLAVLVAAPCHADYAWGEAKLSGRTMGTTYHVAIEYNAYDFFEEQFQTIIDTRLAKINARMSTYDPESELSRFNASRSTDWFDVSTETATVVAAALDIAERTDGAFDPTVGPVVNLWGFGPDGRRKQPPDDEQVATALANVGYQSVQVRIDPPALRKTHPEIYLDLSAIAKGYAADAIAEALHPTALLKPQVDCAMVEIGGEVRTYHKKADGGAWRIGIEVPDSGGRFVNQVVEVDNGDAIATSGDYRNYFEYQGRRYSHTINPQTGRPVEHSLATATVRSASCMQADAMATALMVMGPDRGLEWANAEGVAAVLVERTEDGYRELTTEAWQALSNVGAAGEPDEREESNMGVYFFITAVVFAIALAGMSVGVIFSNRRLKGSCGGLAGLQDATGQTACEMCSNPSPTCTGNPDKRVHGEHAAVK